MRTTIVLVLSLALIGCESDFQKCMNTEVPRATKTLNIDNLREDILELQAMKDDVLINVKNLPAIERYLEANPAPDHGLNMQDYLPNYNEYLVAVRAFETSNSEWQEWDSKRREFLMSVARSNGVAESMTYDEWAERKGEMFLRFNELLKPRAEKYNCWGKAIEGECFLPFSSELISEGLEGFPSARLDEILDITERGIAESISMLIERIGLLEKSAKEVATLACNANGLYE